jgi:DNA-binding SARP family transcriptional activator
LATADPLNSRVARLLMEALAASGDRAGAIQHAAAHRALVQSEVGVEPDSIVSTFAEKLARQPAAATPAGSPPIRRFVAPALGWAPPTNRSHP